MVSGRPLNSQVDPRPVAAACRPSSPSPSPSPSPSRSPSPNPKFSGRPKASVIFVTDGVPYARATPITYQRTRHDVIFMSTFRFNFAGVEHIPPPQKLPKLNSYYYYYYPNRECSSCSWVHGGGLVVFFCFCI